MKLENVKVNIVISEPNGLIGAMTDEEVVDFLQSLSCQDVVIDYVMQQVFDGCTDGGYHGSIAHAWDGDSPLQKFTKLATEAKCSEMAKNRIEELERELDKTEKTIVRLYETLSKYTDLY